MPANPRLQRWPKAWRAAAKRQRGKGRGPDPGNAPFVEVFRTVLGRLWREAEAENWPNPARCRVLSFMQLAKLCARLKRSFSLDRATQSGQRSVVLVHGGAIGNRLTCSRSASSPGSVALRAFIGGVHPAHQVGLATLVRVVDRASCAMARRSAAASALGGTPRVSCQANSISSRRIWMASGEVCCRTAARAIAQSGAAARPRAQLLTWRGVYPEMRAKAAWLTPARASRAANSVCRSALTAYLL